LQISSKSCIDIAIVLFISQTNPHPNNLQSIREEVISKRTEIRLFLGNGKI
jgi:hypothetical protein